MKHMYLIKLLISLVAIHFFCGTGLAHADEVIIGVLAPMGQEKAVKMWQPTIDYLAQTNPDYSFVLFPATKNQLTEAIEQQKVDFFLTNTGHYVELEAKYGATRILTLRREWKGQVYSQWGSVMIALESNKDIFDMDDIKGKKFAAVDPDAFAGFQVAFRELVDAGVMSKSDVKKIIFTGYPHNSPLKAVYDRRADVGVIPTGVLEEAIDSGKIQHNTFRIINQKNEVHFPFYLSSRLYPLWPLAKSRHASERLAEHVVAALLQIPDDHEALRSGSISGWTVPLDYSDIHELMKEIKVGPYKDYGRITLVQFLQQYWQLLVIALAMFVMGVLTILYITKLNNRLTDAQVNLENKIAERTEDLKNVNKQLHDEVLKHQRLHNQLEQNAEDEEVLGKIMQLSLRLTELDGYLEATLQMISDAFPWFNEKNNACIFLVKDVDGQPNLEMVAGINISEKRKATCSLVPFGKCLCGQAAATKAIVFASEIDERHQIESELNDQHGHYCIPIEKGEKLLGVLMIQLPFNHQSSTHEFSFLMRIADVLSMGIARHQAEDEIEYYAYHDTLTNLPNRRLLLDRLDKEFNQFERSGKYGAVIYVDLDDFKTLNDS
ncbi:MAG: PhnD/SsuA/transferrin family substrate-binding protein, partial [Gammaproteobacteria bacterium]|nr:PhnD/SsuA/transferrin family substrate-binding protein [Gammaproteobacteria bacterium]